MVTITNERGAEVTRQIVGVGAIKPGEQRKFTVAVEVFKPEEATESDVASRTGDGDRATSGSANSRSSSAKSPSPAPPRVLRP
jgi:hypothetical protein